MGRKIWFVWVVPAGLLILGLVLGVNTGALSLKPFGVTDVGRLMVTFFVLALFVERTIEVLMTTWRQPQRDGLEAASDTARKRLEANPKDRLLVALAEKANAALVDYKTNTRSIALRAALVAGVIIAAVGVRSLPLFVQLEAALAGWPKTRGGVLNLIDVLISGGIIGGGSEAIHRLMTLVLTSLDATTGKLRAPATEPPRQPSPAPVTNQ